MALRCFVSQLQQLSAARRSAISLSHPLPSLSHIATRLRMLSVSSTSAAGSGHPSSCASIAELLAVLFFDPSGLHYHPQDPQNPSNDKFILSKGHAAPALYAAWTLNGLYSEQQLGQLRKLHSDFEGHPTPRLPFVDVATGSLGQGVNAACGLAYSLKYLERRTGKVFVLMGDGECGEGSVWEGLNFASINGLDNLISIVDVNRLGQSGPTPFGHTLEEYETRTRAFGCHTIVIDGHDIAHIISALEEARTVQGKPVCILAKTVKGKGLVGVEDREDWHGKPMGELTEKTLNHLKSLLSSTAKVAIPQAPTSPEDAIHPTFAPITLPTPHFAGQTATRAAYGQALVAAGHQSPYIIALDGDTRNSTMSHSFLKAFPERFIECYIAEQNMVGVALGVAKRGFVPFASTFGAFFTRAFDHIRMAALSLGNVKLIGSHSGVSIGEDGGSQMGLEDLAMLRALPHSVVLYPSDAYSTYRAVELAANHSGLCYIRTSRPAAPLLYSPVDSFQIGSCKVLRRSASDCITVASAGVTLIEALKAYTLLQEIGLNIRIIDLFSIKPIDAAGLIANAKETKSLILTVEDHSIEGGIRDAVCSAVSEAGIRVWGLGVSGVPHSGRGEELLDLYGLSARRIVEKIRSL